MILTLEVIGEQAEDLGAAGRKVFNAIGGTIGRLPDNDWVFPDPYVSGRHALIRYLNGKYFIEDTSTNGVFINTPDNRLSRTQPHQLHNGDVLFIDAYQIKRLDREGSGSRASATIRSRNCRRAKPRRRTRRSRRRAAAGGRRGSHGKHGDAPGRKDADDDALRRHRVVRLSDMSASASPKPAMPAVAPSRGPRALPSARAAAPSAGRRAAPAASPPAPQSQRRCAPRSADRRRDGTSEGVARRSRHRRTRCRRARPRRCSARCCAPRSAE